MNVGNTLQLTATVLPSTATNKNVSWSSSASGIANVDASGKVSALSAGTAKITVTTEDGGKTASCNITVNSASIPVTSVSLNQATATMNVGATLQLTATVLPSTATNKNVIWSSSASGIANVDASGKVSALATGTAIITATTEDGGKTATCNITVNSASIPVTGVSLNQTTATMIVGNTLQLTATVLPSTATNKKLIWSSSDSYVADVDASGKVFAFAAGTARITVTTEDGGKTASCNITVNPASIPVTGVSLSQTSATMIVGNTLQLTATVLPSDATNKKLIWSSSGSYVADVDASGKVFAFAAGTARITVTTEDGGKTASCNITVNPATISVTSVSLSQTSATMIEGATLQLTATVSPSNATNKNVSWKSSATGIAEVDASGYVTALKVGTARITVTTNDGGQTAYCDITVNPAPIPVTGVSLDQTTATLIKGSALQLTATVSPSNATNKNVSWKSSATGIADVDASGIVTALAAGTARITVTTADGGKTAYCDIKVEVNTEINNPVVYAANVYVNNQNLFIESKDAETIDIYSISGVKIYNTTKSSGLISISCNRLPDGLLIVKGSNGWVKKVVKSSK